LLHDVVTPDAVLDDAVAAPWHWFAVDGVCGYTRRMDRARLPIRVCRLGEEPDDDYIACLTPAERMVLVWPITLQAWAFQTGTTDEPRLRRDVGRVIRGGR
jgi:hypothetical protein